MATVLVTGSSRGIGLELCRMFAARGHDVIAVCRRSSPQLTNLSVRVEEGVDATSAQSIAALAKRLSETRITILVLNAGILEHTSLKNLDFESVHRQFDV